MDPAWVMELTEAAVSSRLNGAMAKRYAPQAKAVAAFLGHIAAGYRSQAANAKNGYARRWFEKHAEHVETWLVQLAAAESV